MDNKKQEKLSEFVNREVFVNQTYLIEKLLKKEVFNYGDVVNLYADLEDNDIIEATKKLMEQDKELSKDTAELETIENLKDEQEPQEVMEWWVVSDWLLNRLEAKGQPVLRTDFGDWWGRCGTGQAILLDRVIEEIYDDLQN